MYIIQVHKPLKSAIVLRIKLVLTFFLEIEKIAVQSHFFRLGLKRTVVGIKVRFKKHIFSYADNFNRAKKRSRLNTLLKRLNGFLMRFFEVLISEGEHRFKWS